MTQFPTRTAAEQRLFDCNQWTEDHLQRKIIRLAEELGWMAYHTHDSRRSNAGWPDLVLVHPRHRRLIIWELKSAKGRPTPAQLAWLTALRNIPGILVGLKRPEDWASNSIQQELAARRHTITTEGTPTE